MEKIKDNFLGLLRWSEKYTNTDMVYLVKNSFWINLSNITSSIFALVLSVAFARYVSKDTYGTYQFLISFSSIITALTLTGMNSAVTSAVAKGFEGVFKKSINVQLKFGLIPFFVGLCGSLYYYFNGNTLLSLAILITSLLLPIVNAFNTWVAFVNGRKDFKNFFILGLFLNVLTYAGLIACIFIFPDALILVSANFILQAIGNFFVYLVVLKKFRPNESYEDDAIEYGKKLSLSSILPALALNIDNILIFHFLGAAPLAIYAFASSVPERLGSLFRPVSIVAMPKFSQLDKSELKEIVPKKTAQFLILLIFAAIIYGLFAHLIFRIFFPAYIESVAFSQIYAIAVIINIAAGIPLTSIFSQRSEKIHLLNIAQPIFSLVALCIGGLFFGIWGIVFGKIISNLFLFTGSLYINKIQ